MVRYAELYHVSRIRYIYYYINKAARFPNRGGIRRARQLGWGGESDTRCGIRRKSIDEEEDAPWEYLNRREGGNLVVGTANYTR